MQTATDRTVRLIDWESVARFSQTAPERELVKKQIELGKAPADIDQEERVEMRMERLGLQPEKAAATAREAKAATSAREALRGTNLGLERIIGENDFVSVTFLESGFRVAQAVGCVRRNDFRIGTGFLVGPRLLLTNAHVIANEEEAEDSSVEFNFQDSLDGSGVQQSFVFRLAPDEFFLTSPEDALDYTLVAVEEVSGAKRLREFGRVELDPRVGKVLRGEPLNIVQHPNGTPKQVALRSNRFTALLPDFMHYETDTDPGSSGSPVFNDQWEVVCLHHAGVPATNSEGQALTKDGRVWRSGIDSPDQIRWIGNEGVRVSRIVADVARQAGSPRPDILKEFPLPAHNPSPNDEELRHRANGRGKAGRTINPRPPVAARDKTRRKVGGSQTPRSKSLTNVGARIAAATSQSSCAVVSIPLQIVLSIGDGRNLQLVQSASNDQRNAGPPIGTDDEVSAEALAERGLKMLERAQTRIYYDADKDRADREEYYRDIDADSSTLFDELRELIVSTHEQQLSYRVARIEHLYAWVDLQRSKKVRSIYSDLRFSPENFIQEDFVLERRVEALLQKRESREGALTPERLERMRSELEAQEPFNCEHVVPQSWFDKLAPMQGDLHHLYTCEGNCNSFRGNRPYHDFQKFAIGREADRPKCGFSDDGLFEPFMGKGKVARATLYFMLRYLNEFDDMYDEDGLETLLQWHEETSADITEHELHRNQAIFEIQGNRNPFIDHPEWARAAFSE